jgi:hypothetical protein
MAAVSSPSTQTTHNPVSKPHKQSANHASEAGTKILFSTIDSWIFPSTSPITKHGFEAIRNAISSFCWDYIRTSALSLLRWASNFRCGAKSMWESWKFLVMIQVSTWLRGKHFTCRIPYEKSPYRRAAKWPIVCSLFDPEDTAAVANLPKIWKFTKENIKWVFPCDTAYSWSAHIWK